jgi:hypothetical protein
MGAGEPSIAQVIFRDRLTSSNKMVSHSAGGDPGSNHSAYTALPVGGDKVIFSSSSTNLVPDGSALNGQYMVDLAAHQDHFSLSVDLFWTFFFPLIGK